MISEPSVLARMKGSSLGAKLLRGGVGSLAVKLGNRALSLVVVVLLARLLGPSGYGVYSFVLAVVMILAVPVRLGLPTLIMRETAKASINRDHASMGALWRWSAQFVSITSLTVVMIGYLLLSVFQERISESQLMTFAWGLPLVLLMGFDSLRSAALRGLHHVVLGQFPALIVQPMLLIICLGVAKLLAQFFALAPSGAMALLVATTACSFVVGALLLHRYRPAGIRASKPSSATARGWIASIIPLALLSGVQVINQSTDIVMLGLLGGNEQVGVYRVAAQGGLLVIFGVQALNQVMMPYFSSIYASGDSTKLQRLVSYGAYATAASALFVAIGFWVFGPTILGVVFGPEYMAAYVPLCILVAGRVFGVSMGQVGVLLSMTGHERRSLRGFLIAFGANVSLNLILIPSFGMTGAAAATAVSHVILNLILWQSVRVRLGVDASVLRVMSRRVR